MNSFPSTVSERPRPLTKGSDILSAAQWQDVCARLKLSERELEVVVGVFDDLKEAAIASRLGISAHTVHTHLERLYRKLGVNGRGRMIIEVLAEHLLACRANSP
jgi:ATP/maltotriose-dependent transcriptional regulator MalT